MSVRPGEGTTERDIEIEALVVDRYLESLLARRPAGMTDVPGDLVAVADRLVADLPRHHPSPTFEEHLAARLAAAAAVTGVDAQALGGDVVIFPVPASPADRGVARPVVIGGVLTSAAISLAGAAFVAWRWSRNPDDPMARAVRAVTRARLA